MKRTYLLPIVGLLGACFPALQGPVEAPSPSVTANAYEVTRVTNDPGVEFAPRPSPDGKWLLYSVYDPQRRGPDGLSIAMVALQGSGKRLVAGPRAVWGTWLPDGKNIVYVSLSGNRPVLVRTTAGGTGITFVTQNPLGGNDDQPDVSPDGRTIAFHTYLQGRYVLASVGIDGSSPTIYVPGSSPRWHPSGKKLIFDREVDGKWQIFTLELDTGQVTQLTSGNYNHAFPSWSPDGKRITFQSDRDGTYQVYLMKEDGTGITQLTKGEGTSHQPSWGTDGYIYFVSTFGSVDFQKREEWRASDIWRVKPRLPEDK